MIRIRVIKSGHARGRAAIAAALVSLIALTLSAPTRVCAASDQQDAPQSPATFADAVTQLGAELQAMDALITADAMSEVSARVEKARTASTALVTLAMRAGSHLDRAVVKDIAVVAKQMGPKLNALAKFAESGAADDARQLLGEVGELYQSLLRLTAQSSDDNSPDLLTYACPMHCEGPKTYAAPGRCPVCGMDLVKAPPRSPDYSVSLLATPFPIKPDEEASLRFSVRDKSKAVVHTFEPVKGALMHVVFVSKDLAWMSHELPEQRGNYEFTEAFTFPAAGAYKLFAHFKPAGAPEQSTVLTAKVPGGPPASVPLAPNSDTPQHVGGIDVQLAFTPQAVEGAPSVFTFTLTKDGKPVRDLEAYLGGLGHCIAIDEHQSLCLHMTPSAASSGAPTPGVVAFQLTLPKPGIYKIWGEFQRGRKVFTVPFVVDFKGLGTSAKGSGKPTD